MNSLPTLGIGIGYRSGIHAEIISRIHEFGFLEIIADAFVRNKRPLQVLSSLITCIPHSLNLSVGSQLDPLYVEELRRILEVAKPPWHSDHLAFTKVDNLNVGHLAPVPYTREALHLVTENVRRVQQATGIPFALENITMPFYWPNNEMEEHEFINEVVRRTGCLLLLDIENVRVNAVNHGNDPRAFIDRLPLEKVIQIHLAGGVHTDGHAHDTHDAPISRETWSLLEYVLQLVTPNGILLERDANLAPFADVMAEVRRAKDMLESATT